MSETSVIESARDEIAKRLAAISSKIVSFRDTLSLYESRKRLYELALVEIDAILADEPALVRVNLGNPTTKGT